MLRAFVSLAPKVQQLGFSGFWALPKLLKPYNIEVLPLNKKDYITYIYIYTHVTFVYIHVHIDICVYGSVFMLAGSAIFCGADGEEALLRSFIAAVQKASVYTGGSREKRGFRDSSVRVAPEGYPENPFHNFGHAVDVQTTIAAPLGLAAADVC